MTIYNMNQRVTAELLGTTPRTLREWGQLGLPRNEDGTLDGPAVVRWAIERRTSRAPDPVYERARKDAESADKLALHNAEKRGTIVAATEAAGLGRCVPRFRSGAGKGVFGARAGGISGRLAVRRGFLAAGSTGQGLSTVGSGSQ